MSRWRGMASRALVDPHHHLWDVTHHPYPWLHRKPADAGPEGDITPIAGDYLLDDYVADTRDFQVVKSVHVQCGWLRSDPVGETEWLQSIADSRGFPHGIVAYAELGDRNVEAVLAGHRQFDNLRGIRQILNWHRDPVKTYLQNPCLLRDESWLCGFGLLKKYDLSFDLQLYPSQLTDAVELAAQHPDQSIILNHAGMPVDRDESALSAWRRGIRLLSRQENVSVKISALGMFDRLWTTASIRPFILETIEAFGTERSMFASNFPVDKLYGTFSALYTAYNDVTSDFSEAERSMMFCSNAERLYRI